MKRAISILSLFLMVTCLAMPVFAECTPEVYWTAAWTDAGGQTTYTLQAPCKVYLGIPFNTTATVTDSSYPNDDVAFGWAIKDNGAVVLGGGFNWLTLANGQWQRVLTQTYQGDPIDHLIEFKFTDLGSGGGAHWWRSNLIGAVTVDPFPPAANALPAVDAGQSLFISSEHQKVTVLQGAASDADGDALTYRWLEGTGEVQSTRPVGVAGAAPLDLGALPALSIGQHTFTLEVSDGKGQVTDSAVVSVENSAPVAAISGGGTFNLGDSIRLNGSVADYDGDPLSYRWLEGETLLAAGEIASLAGGAPVPLPESVIGGLPLGTHTLTLEVRDGIHVAAATTTVSVIDTVAPTLAPVASSSILWPPNGAMTDVTIAANAGDNSGEPVLLSVMVTSNQPQQTDKDGQPIADCSVVSIDQSAGLVVLQLRNARPGKGTDAVYTVKLTAADASGNASSAELSIKTPSDVRRLPPVRRDVRKAK